MSYTKQNFISGQILEADHLNHMEAGIKANAEAIGNISVEVDTTLTKASMAADAKAVGDEIDRLSEDMRVSINSIQNTVSTNMSHIEENCNNIESLNNDVASIQQELADIDTAGYTYYATYGNATLTNGEDAENVFSLYQVNEGQEELVSQFVIQGGSGSTEELEAAISAIQNTVSTNTSNIGANSNNIESLSRNVASIQQELAGLDTEGYTYYATYGSATLANGEEAENVFSLYQAKDGKEEIVSQFVIQGGSGGPVITTNLTVERVTSSPVIVTPSDQVSISYSYSSTDSDGEEIDGNYTWKIGNTVIGTGPCIQGVNTFDFTEHVGVGTQRLTLTVADAGGSVVVKTWTVQVVDVRLESSFSDRVTYPAGQAVKFSFTPYGAVPKAVHFILDGQELDPMLVNSSGVLQSYTLPAQSHGAHLLECYVTATVNGIAVETNHIFKDIVWYDETSDVPVIGCIYRFDHYGKVTAKQYNATNIQFHVFDPNTASPSITKAVDGEIVVTEQLTSSSNLWSYKTADVGEHTLVISCGVTSVTVKMDIKELGIEVNPVTANMAFDFNPVGLSNASADRLWKDDGGVVSMSVSDNFDWVNGGYKLDEEGNQFFCVKAGSRATINYNLFAHDSALYGSEFKCIFKTTNVRNINTTFLSCLAGETPVGLKMNAHEAYLMTSATGDAPLHMPYAENEIIEFEINISPLDQEDSTATAVVLSYEDGVGYKPLIYDSSHRMYQFSNEAVPITIGSDDCDVHVYRMKAYTSDLSDSDILSNFIADSRDAETMIARYERNQIYDENNALTPDSVATSCPQLKIVKLDVPYFTADKNEMVKNTILEIIHKGGDATLDNIRAVNTYHSGQGTTSNEYGFAARNLNVYACFDGTYEHKRVTYDPDYITELTYGDGTKIADGTGKITLTRTSVPNALFNIKVNVASSEHANNSKLAARYDRYLPYTPVSKKRDPRAKTTMEFVNCVVFVRENDPDISKHREFQDTGWHFYSLGNIGDSKDTDITRTSDPDDHNEFCVEIADNTLPNSIFPSGVMDTNGKMVYPISESQWVAGNPAYDSLHNAWGDTFEFRYSHPDITDAEEAENIAVFNRFYKWIVTSTNEQFVNELHNWCVPGSMEYFYLFTERYTMTDNRAKNTFWHWGRYYISQAQAETMGEKAAWFIIDDAAAAINNGYRMEPWDYDNDTSLGINNSGEMTMPAGKEDVDYRTDGDPNSGYIYNAAESVFWCRIRDLMHPQLQSMYINRESAGAWDDEGLIKEFDEWQNQWPEELWRLHIERVYMRTYLAGTRRFLETMLNGRKKYHRHQWERDQRAYMGTKYVATSVKEDQIMFRCNTPQSAVVAPNYDLRLIPYSDMYLSVLYGNSPAPIQIRAKAGQEYLIRNPLSGAMDDTAVLIYCASRIQAINDLSGAYIHDNDFSKAEKLRTLVIGNSTYGYGNQFLTALNIGNNPLLEVLDVRGCPNLTGSLNLTNCGNLKTLYAQGTSLKGVTFAPSGAVENAYLPATVNTLVMKNLHYLTNLQMAYSSLESLTEEYSIVDELSIVQAATTTLKSIRLLGINWTLADTQLMNKILSMNSTILSGKLHIAGAIRQHELDTYSAAWPDLEISYDTLLPQNPVTFINYDGTVLDVQYVVVGEAAVDPVTRAENPIPVPTRPMTEEAIYTHSGWDKDFSKVISAMTVTATYSETVRQYTVRWFNGTQLYDQTTVNYGEEAVCSKPEPTDTSLEEFMIYRLFDRWDKCTSFVKEDLEVHAVYEEASAPKKSENPNWSLVAAKPIELYALTRAGVLASNGGLNASPSSADYYGMITSGDEFDIVLGHDVEYENVESKELVPIEKPLVLDGTNYFNTGVKLFNEDKSFVLAVDFAYDLAKNDSVLMSCSNSANGIILRYSSGASVRYGGVSALRNVSAGTNREMLVIRHRKGDPNLYLYSSDTYEDSVRVQTITRPTVTLHNSELAFGCQYDSFDGFSSDHASGTIFWSKIWYEDLGEETSKELALWYRERLTMQAAGLSDHNFRLHRMSQNGQYCACAFLLKHLMRTKRYMNKTDSNVGGWPETDMRRWLNERVYYALPRIWRKIICAVDITSTKGGATNNLFVTSSDFLWLLAVKEVGGAISAEGDAGEANGTINFFTDNASRIKFANNGLAENSSHWWHRSPYTLDSTSFSHTHVTGLASGNVSSSHYNNGICFGFCI